MNDNNVSLSPREEGEQDTDAVVDTVEIHVDGEASAQTEGKLQETSDTELECLDNSANNENKITFSENNGDISNASQVQTTSEKLSPDEVNKGSPKKHRTIKDIKSKHFVKKSKSKDLKKSMQIFTVLEEEMSSIDDGETPRT